MRYVYLEVTKQQTCMNTDKGHYFDRHFAPIYYAHVNTNEYYRYFKKVSHSLMCYTCTT